jgi:hypothetical protein
MRRKFALKHIVNVCVDNRSQSKIVVPQVRKHKQFALDNERLVIFDLGNLFLLEEQHDLFHNDRFISTFQAKATPLLSYLYD